MSTDYVYWTFSAASQSISAFVAFLLTGYALGHTLIISVRKATTNERKDYEEGVTT